MLPAVSGRSRSVSWSSSGPGGTRNDCRVVHRRPSAPTLTFRATSYAAAALRPCLERRLTCVLAGEGKEIQREDINEIPIDNHRCPCARRFGERCRAVRVLRRQCLLHGSLGLLRKVSDSK